jgi:hypothetical protein
VNGDVVGAVIAGPRAEELGDDLLAGLRAAVDAAAGRLAAAWRAATLGAPAVEVPAAALEAARAANVA